MHEWDVQKFSDQFENFLTATLEARQEAGRDRDYRDHKQWTEEEIEKLQERNQAPVVINRIKTKVNLLTGLQRSRRTSPKALPRTPVHEKDADSVTDAIRFVADNTDFDMTSSDVFESGIVTWGYGAAITEVDENMEVHVRPIDPDRFYFDPHSRRLDFKDAKFMGIVVWMDQEDGKEMFPDKADEIDDLMDTDLVDGDTFEDTPRWVDRDRKRFRLCQHYYRHGGIWYVCYFTEHMFLIEPRPSPYLDEKGNPDNPIEAQSAYIDRDNNRYGEVRTYVWAQDEINHRRSRALHLLSARQTIGDEGVVDVQEAKRELAKADGHVKLKGGPNRRFELLDTGDIAQGQLALYEDAKGDIDSIGANAALSGTSRENDRISGRALQALQQGGISELGQLFDGHAYWEKRIYRQIWHRVKQFWDQERWIRVTDREDNLRWVSLNQPITMGEKLQEMAQEGDQRAQATLQQMINDPRLNQVVEIRNNTTELDVDIILTQSPDYMAIRQEQFQVMANLAKAYGPEAVPFEAMVKLSDMSHKEEVMEMLKPQEEEVDPAQVEAQQRLAAELAELEYRDKQAEVAKKEQDVENDRVQMRKDQADAEAQELENSFFKQYGLPLDDARKSVSASTGA